VVDLDEGQDLPVRPVPEDPDREFPAAEEPLDDRRLVVGLEDLGHPFVEVARGTDDGIVPDPFARSLVKGLDDGRELDAGRNAVEGLDDPERRVGDLVVGEDLLGP
jgi:hypothetical protein